MPASIIEIDQIFKIIFIHSAVIYLHNIIFKAHAHSIKIKNLDNKIKMQKSFYFHTNFKILFKTQNKNLNTIWQFKLFLEFTQQIYGHLQTDELDSVEENRMSNLITNF
jgi:hypothetical protein